MDQIARISARITILVRTLHSVEVLHQIYMATIVSVVNYRVASIVMKFSYSHVQTTGMAFQSVDHVTVLRTKDSLVTVVLPRESVDARLVNNTFQVVIFKKYTLYLHLS